MMQENKRHFFGKVMLLGVLFCAGLCSMQARAAEESVCAEAVSQPLSQLDGRIIAMLDYWAKANAQYSAECFAKSLIDAQEEVKKREKDASKVSFLQRLVKMDRKRALIIALATVALAVCMTPTVSTSIYQGAESIYIFGLKALLALPLSKAKKEALANKIEVLEAKYKKLGDECPEFKIKDTFDNFKWSGGMVGFTALFIECLLGEDSTKLK